MAPPMSSNDNGGDNTTSTPTNSSSTTTTAPLSKGRTSVTPTRPSNNYASTNTPIASAKRPSTKKRTPVPSSSAKKSSSSSANGRVGSGNNNSSSSSTPKTPIRTPVKSTSKKDHSAGATSNSNKEAATTTTPARYVNLSPMHNVKAVPRDSHHTTTSKTTTNNEEAAAGADIVGTESTLSVVTEGPTGAAVAAAATTSTTTAEMTTAESPSNNSASAWVGRKVDAIFSPVLSFLNGAGASSSSSSSCGGGGGGGEEKGGDGEKKTDNDGSDRSEKENKLEKKMGGSGDDGEDEVENMVKSDLQKAVEYTRSRTDSSFDDIPGMTNTDSSGSNVIDADGDVTMADCYMNQRDKENGTDDNEQYLKVTLNNQDEEEEDDEEEYYDEDEDDEEEFNPYLFIKSLPPYEYALPPGWKNRPKALPPADHGSHPICLVLDLDETLVHCTVEPVADADMIFPVEFNGMNYQVHVRCRPFLTEFLEAVSKKFEVVIFTASQQVYADKLLDKIDPEGKYIRYRMFRDSCLPVEGNYLKDLTVLGRDLSKAVLVDNSPHAFGYQVDNGIPIESWFDDPKDKELLKLEKFLRTLHGVEDVREVVRNTFQSHLLVKNA